MIVGRGRTHGRVQRSLDVGGELAGRALGRAGLRRMTLFERRLEPGSRRPAGREGLTHGWLGAEEVAALAAEREVDADELLGRLERGDRCFGTTAEGRLVASRWVARGSVEVPFLRAGLRLSEEDAWVWDSWTAPSLRGAGLARAASAAMGDALEPEGVHRLLAGVMVGNRPGRAAVLGSGYRPLGTITSVRALTSRRVRFRARRQA